MAKGEAQLCGVAARGVTQAYGVQRSEHQTFAVNRHVSQPSDMDRGTYQTYSMGKDAHQSYDMTRDVGQHFEIPLNAAPSFDMTRNLTQTFQAARGVQPQFEMNRGGVQLQCDMSRGVSHPFEQQRVGNALYDMARAPQGYETDRGNHQYEMPRTQPYEVRVTHPLQTQHQYNYDKGYQDSIQDQDTSLAKGDQPQFLLDAKQNMEMPLKMPKTAPQRTVRAKAGQKTSGHPYDFAKGYAQQLEMAKKAAQSTIQAKLMAQKNEKARQEAALAEKTKHITEETKSKGNTQPSEILKLYAQQLQTVKKATKSLGAGKMSTRQLVDTGPSKGEEYPKKQYSHLESQERPRRRKDSVRSCETMKDEEDVAGNKDMTADDVEDDSEHMDEGDPPPFEMAKYMVELSKTRTNCIRERQNCDVADVTTVREETPRTPTEAANPSSLPFSVELMKSLTQSFRGASAKGVGGARAERDRQELTIANKAKLIQQVEARGAKKKADIAREWGVRPSTLSTIMKNKDKILTQFKSQRYAAGRRRMRTAAYPDVEEALLTWFRHARAAGIPITGPVLQGMGVTLAQELGHPEFSCSVGWLDRFKARHGLSFNPKNSQDSGTVGTFNEPPDQVPSPTASSPNESDTDTNTSSHSWFPPAMPAVATGVTLDLTENSSPSWVSNTVSGLSNNSEETEEQLSKWLPVDMAVEECSDSEAAEDPAGTWLSDIIPALLKDKQPKDIFSAGETALFYNLLPDRSLVVKGEDGHRWTWVKERITVLVGVNMDGSEKLPLFVIGQSPTGKVKGDTEPVDVFPLPFETNDSALMTPVLFEGWLRQLNRQYRASNRTVSIILENCPAHSSSEDLSNVDLVFLPADTSSRLQPVERGVIHTLKSLYRRSLLERLVDALEAGRSYEITLHEAMELLQRAWKKVKMESIVESFKLAGLEAAQDPADGAGPGGKDVLALLERARRSGLDIPTDVTFESYLKVDSKVQTTVEQERESKIRVGSNGAADPTSPGEALQALATLQKFIEEQGGPGSLLDQLADVLSWVAKHIVKPEVSITE